jgi:hypothetical protein
MAQQQSQPPSERPSNEQAKRAPTRQEGARPAEGPPQPTLKCPFCSGKRFDIGRDVFAGPDQLMYCRIAPAKGQHPKEGFSLPMKGAVCLDCGYVAMMVDINQLHAPIRRPAGADSEPAQATGAAAHLARSPVDEAAEALARMMSQPAAGAAAGPAAGNGAGGFDDGFGDLERLLNEAEKGRPRDL